METLLSLPERKIENFPDSYLKIPYPKILQYTLGSPGFWFRKAAYEVGENYLDIHFKLFFELYPKSTDLDRLGIPLTKIIRTSAYGVTDVPENLENLVSIYRYIRILAYNGKLVPRVEIAKNNSFPKFIYGSELFVCPTEILIRAVSSKNSELLNYILKLVDTDNIKEIGMTLVLNTLFRAKDYDLALTLARKMPIDLQFIDIPVLSRIPDKSEILQILHIPIDLPEQPPSTLTTYIQSEDLLNLLNIEPIIGLSTEESMAVVKMDSVTIFNAILWCLYGGD